MRALFVNSDTFGSKIIRFGTDDAISHVAILFNDHHLIYHAYSTEVQQTPIQDFFDKYNLVDFVDFPTTHEQEKKILKIFRNSIWFQGYDYNSLFYFAWDRLKNKLFKTRQAKRNKLDSENDYICVEIFYILDDAYKSVCGKHILPYEVDLAMTKPGQLCSIFKKSKEGFS